MCQFAITSVCNALCGFCNFAVDEMLLETRHSVSLKDAKKAAENLYKNGVYFLIYVGGEPLLPPQLNEMIISLDATSVTEHEENRGLKGVCARIKEANV